MVFEVLWEYLETVMFGASVVGFSVIMLNIIFDNFEERGEEVAFVSIVFVGVLVVYYFVFVVVVSWFVGLSFLMVK